MTCTKLFWQNRQAWHDERYQAKKLQALHLIPYKEVSHLEMEGHNA